MTPKEFESKILNLTSQYIKENDIEKLCLKINYSDKKLNYIIISKNNCIDNE